MPAKVPGILKTAASQSIYRALLDVIRKEGAFVAEEKKTSIHLSNGRAFAGVHPRNYGMVLNLVLDEPLVHARVHKSEQVSANRHHVEFKLEAPSDVDRQLAGWIVKAYRLTG